MNNVNKILRIIRGVAWRIVHPSYIITNVIFKLYQYLPIDENMMIFHTEGDYCDNGLVFYKYLQGLKDGKKRKFVWLVYHPENFHNTENTKFVKFSWNGWKLKQEYYISRTRFLFETHNLVQRRLRKNQTYVSLWHGTGFKAPKGGGHGQTVFDYVLGTSTPLQPYQGHFVGCGPSLVLNLGFPRNDFLIDKSDIGVNNPILDKPNYKKVIVWMTTFKTSDNKSLSEDACDNETGLPLLSSVEQLSLFNKYLAEKNVFMIIKIHHLQAAKEAFHEKFSNIKILQDSELLQKDIPLYEMVAKTDALITDYSSIYIDYILLNKPMAFVLEDLQKYTGSRGFMVDNIEDYLPGPHIYKMEELCSFIDNVANDVDTHKEERAKMLPFYHDHPDNKSCERIKNYFNL